MENLLLTRRNWLKKTGLACSALGLYPILPFESENYIMTVNGPIKAKKTGKILPHEHIMVDFIGAEQANPNRYNRDEVFDKALPFLLDAKKLGCRTLFECTPNYLGRDPELLKALSEASGLHIITNTGYYAANQYKHLPEHAKQATARQIAQKWIDEWEQGIDGTAVKPGFIKIGNDPGEHINYDQKLIRAAAKTHLATGLTIANHLSSGYNAIEKIDILNILKEEGVGANAWIWVHAQNEKDKNKHIEVARQGAWIEFDSISPEQLDWHAELVNHMRKEGFLSRTLISHDAGWYHVGEQDGGNYRGYDLLFNSFLPKLKTLGFHNADIEQLMHKNPAKAFCIQKRPVK